MQSLAEAVRLLPNHITATVGDAVRAALPRALDPIVPPSPAFSRAADESDDRDDLDAKEMEAQAVNGGAGATDDPVLKVFNEQVKTYRAADPDFKQTWAEATKAVHQQLTHSSRPP